MDIPHVGTIAIRNNVCGVKFHQHLIEDTRCVLTNSKNKERKRLNNFLLTKHNITKLAHSSRLNRSNKPKSRKLFNYI